MKFIYHKSLENINSIIEEYLETGVKSKGVDFTILEDCIVIEPPDIDSPNIFGILSDDYSEINLPIVGVDDLENPNSKLN